MPRKMSGSAMRTMEASIVAMSIPRVVMNSAVHLWRSLAAGDPGEWTPRARTVVTPPPPAHPPDQVPVRLCSVGFRLLTSRISTLRFRNPVFRLW